jgi:hypothetical protein
VLRHGRMAIPRRELERAERSGQPWDMEKALPEGRPNPDGGEIVFQKWARAWCYDGLRDDALNNHTRTRVC